MIKKLLICFGLATAVHAIERPNIIFIMVDDMGRDWVSCYGASHPTPNIDRLATQGVRYETAWCTPICTPTRVTLLTGLYPCHHGWVQHYDVPRWGGAGLRPDRFTTFARLYVGKDIPLRLVVNGRSIILERKPVSLSNMASMSIVFGQVSKPVSRKLKNAFGTVLLQPMANVKSHLRARQN